MAAAVLEIALYCVGLSAAVTVTTWLVILTVAGIALLVDGIKEWLD